MPIKIEAIGKTYGHLTVFAATDERKYGGRRVWLCRCVCGNVVKRTSAALLKSQSCGCTRRGHRHGIHNSSGHPLYSIWKNMIERCENTSHESYANYGGRGITICDRWRESVVNFITDMAPRPDGMTLERRDNSLGYSPQNCIWVTRKQQQRNRRTNHLIEFQGQTRCIAEWAETIGVRPGTIHRRLGRGWSIEDTLRSRR